MKIRYKDNMIEREKIIEKLEGWLAYISHANAHHYSEKLISQFNDSFPPKQEIKIDSVKKHENLNKKIDSSKINKTQRKTLFLFKKGFTIKKIVERRKLKEGTIWEHLANLADNHYVKLGQLLPNKKVRIILNKIKDPNTTLKEIKAKVLDNSISYNQIQCVLAVIKGKQKKKNLIYWTNWYKSTNCRRKCYSNKQQRKICRKEIEKVAISNSDKKLTKNEFLGFIHNQFSICILPKKERDRFMSFREFRKMKKMKK